MEGECNRVRGRNLDGIGEAVARLAPRPVRGIDPTVGFRGARNDW